MKKIWIVLVVVLIAGFGIRSYLQHRVPDSQLISQYVEGQERPTPGMDADAPAPTLWPTTSPTPFVSTPSLNASDQKKVSILKEIFKTRNDNDPRMDTDLVNLSPELKREFQGIYRNTRRENLNERGTIVFLIGREIKTQEDVNFLKDVLQEKPCLSLGDCSKPTTGGSAEEAHLDAVNETTANYPQLMALRALIERYDRAQTDADREPILNAIRESTRSPNPRVAEEAKNALEQFGKN